MKISAIMDGNVVTIGDISILGSDVYIVYTDSNSVLNITKKFIPSGSGTITSAGAYIPIQLCTSAVVVS